MALLTPYLQVTVLDDDGNPQVASNADAYFYETGTLVPAEVFEDAELESPHPQPVRADSRGVFPPIYFDRETPLRVKIVEDDGNPDTPLYDIDPVTEDITVGAANIEDGAIEEKLGYVPAKITTNIFTGQQRLNYTPVALAVDEAGFRGTPVNIKNVNYTFVLDDAGKFVLKTGTDEIDWTIPPNEDVAFPVGTTILLANLNTTAIDLVRGSDVVLTASGDTDFTDEDKTIAAGAYGTLIQTAADTWVLLV